MATEAKAQAWLARQRVARLASADASAAPHVIPVCFALSPDAQSLYITVDEKPKDTSRPLKRVRNILETPQVALVADHWDEDWSQLAWVMVRGPADVIEMGEKSGSEHAAAQVLLRAKYPQYQDMTLEPLPVIAVRIARLTWWGRLDS